MNKNGTDDNPIIKRFRYIFWILRRDGVSKHTQRVLGLSACKQRTPADIRYKWFMASKFSLTIPPPLATLIAASWDTSASWSTIVS